MQATMDELDRQNKTLQTNALNTQQQHHEEDAQGIIKELNP